MSTEPASETILLSRVERLERQNRLMQGCLLCVLVAGSAAILVAANTNDDTLEAKQIIIRDDDGNKRVLLGVDKTTKSAVSRTGVFVYSEDGKGTVGLTAGKEFAHLVVDQRGEHRLSLGTGKDEYAGLLIYAKPGKKAGQMLLFYTGDGKPTFGMNDSNGKTRIMMLLDNKRSEKPVFALQDANQKSFFAQVQP